MSAKSFAPTSPSRTSSSSTGVSHAGEPELSNSEQLELLQQEANIADISTSGSFMYGELDWLQDWLEAGPQPLEHIEAGQLEPLPHLVVKDSREWGHGTVQAGVSGRAQLSGSPSATGTGTVSASGESAQASATGTVTAAPGSVSASGSASGSVEQDGHQLGISASGSASTSGQAYGQVSATMGHEGQTGDLQHSIQTSGSVDSAGAASLNGAVGGTLSRGDSNLTASADGRINNSGEADGRLQGAFSHSGSIGDLDHTVQSSGSIDSSGLASLDGSVGGSIEKGGNQLAVSAGGQVNNKGLMKGKLLGQFNHKGSTGDLDHSLQSSGSIDSTGKANMAVKGRIGSSSTTQEGDSTVTTSSYLGAGADLNKGLGGEVGMMRKAVSDGKTGITSASASVDQQGGKLALSNKNIRERSRDATELSFQGKHDGSSVIKVGGQASGELWRKSELLAPDVSATTRALGGGMGGSLSFTREADGSAALGANAKASLTLAEGVVYAERDLIDVGDTGLDWDGRLRAAAEATVDGNASLKLDKGMAVEAGVKAFAGARAEASTGMTVTWDRREDYGPMLEDFADNLPGTWDDELLDRIPDQWWTNVGRVLFGKGQTDLLRVGVGVDARAGAGAEASVSGSVNDKGMFETEVSAGAALGVGGGARFQMGFNPIDLLRRGLADSIEAVNASFSYAESLWRSAVEQFGGDEAVKAKAIELATENASQGPTAN